ncbi:Glucan endo-1,3-alpha-glucosidase agn1 [Vermiconidia calcicola]|uniref:Glucan endo-1,3-alpha-glucosidase agn1 n=1 Tax=Vermiconidia calcicola TaxID=1690605 RepID=A0ACC3MHG5_9PEZI|nr:Glucan endo-1,3-alpha-glucosidase agn1 [Vermiconidia calcicola]
MHGRWVCLGTSALLYAFTSGLATPRDLPALAELLDQLVDDPGNAGYAPEDYAVCDYSLEYDSLFDLNAAIASSALTATTGPFAETAGTLAGGGTMRSDCVSAYALHALINMLNTAWANYTSVNDGYDKEFGYYLKYMEETVPEIIDNVFMFDTSTGTILQTFMMPPVGPGMQYFECKTDGSDSTFPCTDMVDRIRGDDSKTTTLTLKDGMEDDYNAALVKAGITPDWVHFGDHTFTHHWTTPRLSAVYHYKFSGFPIPKADMGITNPKDIVTEAIPNLPELRIDMQATLMDIMLGNFAGGSTTAAAHAYSTPVFMLMQAVDDMAQAKKLGEKEEEEEEKERVNFIIMIVSVVLLFVPIVGQQAALAAGMATLARSIAIAGELGQGALGIYDTVNNPGSAVINILGMLIGVGATTKVPRDAPGLTEVATLARSISPDMAANFGAIFKHNFDDLQTTMKFCNH